MTGKERPVTAKLSLLIAATLVLSAVCSGQFLGLDSSKSAAKVLTLTGRVSVIRETNPEPWALQAGDQVQAKQLIITGRRRSRWRTDPRLWCIRTRV
jgi:hypothetical protein